MRRSRVEAVGSMAAVLFTAMWVFGGAGEGFTEDSFVEIARLTNPDLEPEAWFGNMAISGNTIVVGAHGDDLPGMTDAGSAHVFVGSGSTWVLQQSLTAPDGAPLDHFGLPLAISGDTIAVGAPYHDSPYYHGGAVWVFTRTAGTWNFQQKLAFSNHGGSDRCGDGLDVSGDTIVVGCTDGPGAGGGSPGKVYVFARTGTVWTEQALFTASDVGYNDYFGKGLALVGDTLVIGSRGNDPSGIENAGAVYVYGKSGTAWVFDQKITASDAGEGDNFGEFMDFDGNTILVGSYADDHSACTDAGSAYVFTRVGGTWVEQQKLIAEAPIDHDVFGWSSSVWADMALIGTSGPFRDPNTWETTATDIFTRTDETFHRQQRVLGGDLGCWLGWYVAAEGDLALVSGCDPDLGVGAVHVFMEGALLLDGFESGDTSAWSSTVP